MILEMPTKSQRREALVKLPIDLYDSFQGIITRIQGRPNASAELGMRILMWLHFAYRPLKLVELQHALAVRNGHLEFDSDNIVSQKLLLDSCLGLVIIDEETLTVRFVHFTLEEYFRDNFRTEFPNGYSSIAETCLTYLTFGKLRQHCTSLESLEEMMAKYPFLNYAALYWGSYVKQQHSDSLTKLVRMLVEHESECPPCAIQALYSEITERRKRSMYDDSQKDLAQKFSGIHAIAYFGLSENVVNFCEVDLNDDTGRTPLSWAAGAGHEAVVRLLVERDGVDVNSKDCGGVTSLMWAIKRRDDVEINAKDNSGERALICAAQRGHDAVVRLLIERDDVEISAKDDEGMTAFILAAYYGYDAIVQLLIERDVEINAKDNGERTALAWAAAYGRDAVVRLLIERDDVEINTKDCKGITALMWAAFCGYDAVVRLLIERDDVEINANDDGGTTALIWAAERGHYAVVRLLIERDEVDINAMNNEGKTALSWADANMKSPPWYTTKERLKAIVQLLNDRLDVLARGSDIAPGT